MKAIFATTQDYLLGLNGTMPWALTEEYNKISKIDMDYFKEMTAGARVVMGYNTWVSIGEKPLKGRKDHFVITSKKGLTHQDSRVKFMTLQKFLKKYSRQDDIICIGGGKLYRELLPFFTEIYWNELNLNDEHYRNLLTKHFVDKEKVYLSRRIVHLLNHPQTAGMSEKATAMLIDSVGNTITFHRYGKNPFQINKINNEKFQTNQTSKTNKRIG